MIHTVGLNPALDQTVTLDRLVVGEVNRATGTRTDPGGKSVNVASILSDWGLPVTVHGLLGAGNTDSFEALFAQKHITDQMVRVPGLTRTNIKIVEPDGRTTDINLPGFDGDAEALYRLRFGLADVRGLVVVSGSQPARLQAGATSDLIAGLIAQGAQVVLDVSGAPLKAALEARALPHVIKPNQHELQDYTGTDLSNRTDLVAAGQALVARGIGLVVISLGIDGAVFLTRDGGVQVAPVTLATGSTVGAGDAMVAGITAGLAEGLALPDLARQATAFSGAKLQNPGPHLPSVETVRTLASQITPRPVADWIAGA
ncbi:MAG: 1-phosphofructokinase family hexose kinase [Paracoccus sp. (in: a-proteobacteria)]|uniref:1-phosphofructokinase family hexose kinase n=1 Tax=Paracoccus sp. TaxID=267 RepID=UPI0026DED2E3|nr:1-phosphofructokinase family hexose kinase [Paracoccus sp. (in: a-proteobacteria)]MDO5620977.1 1-phosphofructokinase family hexose kinase [Paracoccus sp. (in: a-proteobacteria)]